MLRQLRDEYTSVLAEHQRLVREAFGKHGGHEVDTQGDSFFIAFLLPRDAASIGRHGSAPPGTAARSSSRRRHERSWRTTRTSFPASSCATSAHGIRRLTFELPGPGRAARERRIRRLY